MSTRNKSYKVLAMSRGQVVTEYTCTELVDTFIVADMVRALGCLAMIVIG